MRRLAVKNAVAPRDRRAAQYVITSVIATKSKNIPSAGVIVDPFYRSNPAKAPVRLGPRDPAVLPQSFH
jgi:hypothetical protein